MNKMPNLSQWLLREWGRTLYGLSIPLGSNNFLIELISWTYPDKFRIRFCSEQRVIIYKNKTTVTFSISKRTGQKKRTYRFGWFTIENLISFHQSQTMLSTNASTVLRCPFIDIRFNLCKNLWRYVSRMYRNNKEKAEEYNQAFELGHRNYHIIITWSWNIKM